MARSVCCLIGGGGLAGRHLVPVMQAAGRKVVIFDEHPPAANFPATEYIVGPWHDTSILASLLARSEEVVDLAYANHHRGSFDNPISDLLEYAPPSVTLFRLAINYRHVRRILFVSSGGTVYGPNTPCPTPETAPNQPISPFGITNLTIEKYASMFYFTRGLPILVARPSNAYGPGQPVAAGKGFIATAIGSILGGQPIPLYGGGNTIRDYIYAEDYARGILALLERGQPGETYNLGSSIGLSNLQVVERLAPIAQARGHALAVDHQPARGFDIPTSVLDIKKITQATGWQPIMPFDEGLMLTWDAAAATIPTSSSG